MNNSFHPAEKKAVCTEELKTKCSLKQEKCISFGEIQTTFNNTRKMSKNKNRLSVVSSGFTL